MSPGLGLSWGAGDESPVSSQVGAPGLPGLLSGSGRLLGAGQAVPRWPGYRAVSRPVLPALLAWARECVWVGGVPDTGSRWPDKLQDVQSCGISDKQ